MTTMVRRSVLAGAAAVVMGGLLVVVATGPASGSIPVAQAKPAPNVLSVSPDSGDPSGRVHVLVSGTHFRHVSSVTVGGKSARFTVEGHRRILVRVPQLRAGSYHVVVHTAAGASPADDASRYTYAGTPWRVDETPPGTRHGVSRLDSAACGAAACYAVGSHADSATAPTSPLVERHDAHGWTRERVHLDSTVDPSGSVALGGVECPADGPCITGGFGQPTSPSIDPNDLVAVRVRGVWQATFVGPPDGAGENYLGSRSPYRCAQEACIAVSAVRTDSNHTGFFVRRYADGGWTTQVLGTIDTVMTSINVDCPSMTQCVGLGTTGTQLIGVRISLGPTPDVSSETLDWTFHKGGDEFHAGVIRCASPSFCVAAAEELIGSDDEDYPDVEVDSFFVRYAQHQWVGHHFAAPESVRSADPKVVESDVGCLSGGTCYVVGYATAGKHSWATATSVTTTAQATKLTAVPDPYRHFYIDWRVSCGNGATCTALGNSPGNQDPFRLHQEPAQRFLVHLGSKDRPELFRLPTDYKNLAYYEGLDYACSGPGNCVIAGVVILRATGSVGPGRTRAYVMSN